VIARVLAFALVAGFMAVSFPASTAWAAREAAFLSPGGSRGGGTSSRTGDEDVSIEPKADVDVGETPVNVGRRATFFFVNHTNKAISIEEIKANGDSNVQADIVEDDCSKEGKILGSSRCSVTMETTPMGIGSWTAELLMTHSGAGRIARARVSGRTSSGVTEKPGSGLSLSTKDSRTIEFGDTEIGTGKAVRSALMVNDSNEVISILSIEVIAAENGLQRLEQGCLVDMELKMGESCPVTLVWQPEAKGALSTDLIIRHTGRLGFAVVPIRGVALFPSDDEGGDKEGGKNGKGTAASKTSRPSTSATGSRESQGIPQPPTAEELEKMMAGSIPPVSAGVLPEEGGIASKPAAPKGEEGTYHLIGTVGSRALIYTPDGETKVVAVGEKLEDASGRTMTLARLSPREAEVVIEGKKKILALEAVSTLTQRASTMRERKRDDLSAGQAGKKKANVSSESGSYQQKGSSAGSIAPLPTVK